MVNTENSADNEILSLQVTLILTHDSTKCLVSSLHFCQATNFPLWTQENIKLPRGKSYLHLLLY